VGLASQPGGNLGDKHGMGKPKSCRAGKICAPIWKHKRPAVIATQPPCTLRDYF
jgi:hypothetical protein